MTQVNNDILKRLTAVQKAITEQPNTMAGISRDFYGLYQRNRKSMGTLAQEVADIISTLQAEPVVPNAEGVDDGQQSETEEEKKVEEGQATGNSLPNQTTGEGGTTQEPPTPEESGQDNGVSNANPEDSKETDAKESNTENTNTGSASEASVLAKLRKQS